MGTHFLASYAPCTLFGISQGTSSSTKHHEQTRHCISIRRRSGRSSNGSRRWHCTLWGRLQPVVRDHWLPVRGCLPPGQLCCQQSCLQRCLRTDLFLQRQMPRRLPKQERRLRGPKRQQLQPDHLQRPSVCLHISLSCHLRWSSHHPGHPASFGSSPRRCDQGRRSINPINNTSQTESRTKTWTRPPYIQVSNTVSR